MSKFICEFKDKLLIICILVLIFDTVCMSGKTYADGATGGTNIANCGGNKDGSNGIYCPKQGDTNGDEYKVKNMYTNDWDLGVYRYPDEEIQEEIAALAVEAANNDNIGYCQAHRYTFKEEAMKVDYSPAAITNLCESDCSASSCTIVCLVGYMKDIDSFKNIAITTTTYMPSELTKCGFERVMDGTKKAGDILVASPHATIYVGDATCTSTGLTSYDSDEIDLDKLQKKLKLKGLPTTVTYAGAKKTPNIFDLIKGLLDFIVGLLFMGLKIVVMGFTELAENITSDLLHKVQDVKISS